MTTRLVFDPRPAAGDPGHSRRVTVAPRQRSLDGAVVATVDNGKLHAGALLQQVVVELSRTWSIAGVVHVGPPSPGHGGNLADAEAAACFATVAITGVGDCGSCTSGTALDAIIFERLGIPAVPIVTRPFLPTAAAITSLHVPGAYTIAVVDHPLADVDASGLAARAASAAEQVAAALLRD